MADNKTKTHTTFQGLTKKGPRHPLQQRLDPDANVTSLSFEYSNPPQPLREKIRGHKGAASCAARISISKKIGSKLEAQTQNQFTDPQDSKSTRSCRFFFCSRPAKNVHFCVGITITSCRTPIPGAGSRVPCPL